MPPAVHAAGRFNQKLTHADDRFPLGRLTTPTHSVSLLEELHRRYPVQWDGRVCLWRAMFGAEREVYFVQEHSPGRQGLSDLTVADELKLEIASVALTHRPFQFALAYSGWRHVTVIDTG